MRSEGGNPGGETRPKIGGWWGYLQQPVSGRCGLSGSRSRGPAAVGLRAVAERPKVPCSLGGRREGRMWRGLAFQGPSSLSGEMGIGPSPGQQSPPPLSSFWLFLGRRQPEGLLFRAVVAQVLGGGPGRWGGSFEIRFLSHICGHVATLDHGESLVARSCFFSVSFLKGLTCPC